MKLDKPLIDPLEPISAPEDIAELDHLYRTAPVGLCLLDTELRYLRINERLAEINGRPVSAHIGRQVREVLPQLAEMLEPLLRRVIETREPVLDLEVSATTPAQPGVQRDWLVSYYPLMSDDGDVQAVSAVVEEVSARKRAEQALQRAYDELEGQVEKRTVELAHANAELREQDEERLEAEAALRESRARMLLLLETTNAVPWEADATTWQFTYVGPQAIKLFGYPLDHWYRQDFWPEHIHPDDRERAIAFCLKSSQTSTDYEFEYRMIAADGRIVWLHDIVNVVSVNGTPQTLRGFLIDITERKRAQEEMRQLRERLAHVARLSTMGEMTAGIAHEMNQPLAAIATYAQACSRLLRAEVAANPDILSTMELIGEEAIRAGGIIHNLREFASKRESRRDVCHVNELVRDVARLADVDSRLQRIGLRLQLAKELPIILADSVQIQQVILNLVRNAVEATERVKEVGKGITVYTALADGPEVHISVADAGTGVAPEAAEK
ncbi:MAG: PAS domain-containing protein, partial [Candidatus Palauibacterales bacterium]|nr:PAS domain-containing protein [Candidatus Palauibacterales bacterium]